MFLFPSNLSSPLLLLAGDPAIDLVTENINAIRRECRHIPTTVAVILKEIDSPTPGDIWQSLQTLSCHDWRGRCSWHLARGTPGILVDTLQCMGRPSTAKNAPVPNGSSAEAENPCTTLPPARLWPTDSDFPPTFLLSWTVPIWVPTSCTSLNNQQGHLGGSAGKH